MRENSSFGYIYSRSLYILRLWLVTFLRTDLYFAINVYESRFWRWRSHRQRVPALRCLKSARYSRIPRFNIRNHAATIRWTIDHGKSLPVASLSGDDESVRRYAPVPLAAREAVILTMKLSAFNMTSATANGL